MAEQPVDLKPFLKNGLQYRLATVLYNNIFQPVFNLLDRISAYFTRRWCEDNSLALREMKAAEKARQN
jgi:hypothetical protein